MMNRWTILLALPLLLVGCASPPSVVVTDADEGTLEAQTLRPLPAGGADVLGADTFAAFQGGSSSAVKLESIAPSGRTFTRAWRVSGLAPLEQPYLSQLSASSVAAVKKGDVMVVQFWARSVGGPAQTEFAFESNDTYAKSAMVGVQLNPQWKLYSVPFKAELDYAAGNGGARFRLGYDQQSFELGGVVLKKGPTKIRGLSRFPEGRVPLTKQVLEFVVEYPCSDLKQKVSPARGPPHRLLLDEPLADHLIDGGLDEARRDALPSTVPLAIVHHVSLVVADIADHLRHVLLHFSEADKVGL